MLTWHPFSLTNHLHSHVISIRCSCTFFSIQKSCRLIIMLHANRKDIPLAHGIHIFHMGSATQPCSLSNAHVKSHQIDVSSFVMLPRSTHFKCRFSPPFLPSALIPLGGGCRMVRFRPDTVCKLKPGPSLPLVVHGLVFERHASRSSRSGRRVLASQTTGRVPVASRQAASMLSRKRDPGARRRWGISSHGSRSSLRRAIRGCSSLIRRAVWVRYLERPPVVAITSTRFCG
jgi:hypothetical protein